VPVPATYLRARDTTPEGIELTFANVADPVAAFGFVVIGAFCFIERSAIPLLFTPIVLLFFLRDVWTFCYRGPRVRHNLQLFGVKLWRSEWHLEKIDTASADLIEDSIFMVQRPRWYKLNLWSCAQQRDHTLMRSNDPDELDRLVTLLNDTIKEVSANAAS
jgi:hypothetical protein